MRAVAGRGLNVLILIPSSYGGGAERLVLDQLRNTRARDLRLKVVSLHKGNLEEDFAAYSCYESVDAKRKLSLKTLAALQHIVRKNRIEIVHCHLLEAEFYGFLLKLLNPRLKLICTRHTADDPMRKRLLFRLLIKATSSNSDRIIAVSRDVKTFTIENEWIDESKVIVIMNGVDHRRFRPMESEKTRKGLGLSKRDFCVGVVGRLVKHKGHRYALEAVKRLQPLIPNLRLVVVGKGELEGEMRALSRELGIEENVRFIGFRRDLPEIYSALDVLCLPSTVEGFGLVIVEAMLCKTPVVATHLTCIREIATDGEEALLVAPRDVRGLAQALKKIHDGTYDKRMIARAYAKSLQLYTFDENLRALEETYRSVAKIDEEDFIKRFKKGEEEVLRREAEKVRAVRRVAETTKLFRAPELLEENPEEGFLRLEKIKRGRELRGLLAWRNNIFFSDLDGLRRLYRKLGRAFAVLHERLVLKEKEVLELEELGESFTKRERCFLHGDAGLSNILIADKEVWLIDPSLNNYQHRINAYGPYYYDLAQLIVYTRSILPLVALPFYKKGNCATLKEALLKGYAQKRGVTIDRRKLERVERFILEKYLAFIEKRSNPLVAIRRMLVRKELKRYEKGG